MPIDPDKMIKARYAEAWSMSFFGNPKMQVVCGSCSAMFETRNYIPEHTTREAIACCPHCGMWNKTGLVMT